MYGDAFADDCAGGHSWVEGAVGVLEDDLHTSSEVSELSSAHGVDGLSVEDDLSVVGFLELEDGASEGGFTATALPY